MVVQLTTSWSGWVGVAFILIYMIVFGLTWGPGASSFISFLSATCSLIPRRSTVGNAS